MRILASTAPINSTVLLPFCMILDKKTLAGVVNSPNVSKLIARGAESLCQTRLNLNSLLMTIPARHGRILPP